MNKTLVIVGSHPDTRADFDFSRTDCDVWLFNEAISKKENTWAKRADAIFQMHQEAIWRNPQNRNDPDHCKWLQSGNTPTIFMQDKYPDVPKAEKYPLAELSQYLLAPVTVYVDKKPTQLRFFTNSVDYALAYAAYLCKTQHTYRRIEVYGVEMETNTEYQYQRPGVAFWLGYLSGMGVEMDLHVRMFNAPLYGYEGEVVLSDDTFQKRLAELEPLIAPIPPQFHAAKVVFNKAMQAMLEFDNSKALLEAVKNLAQKGLELGLLDGAKQENARYQGKVDEMKKAAGTFLFSRQEFESAFSNLSKQYVTSVDVTNSFGGQLQLLHDNVVRAAKGSPKRAQLLKSYATLAERYFMEHNKAAILQGAAEENRRYMIYLDEHIRAAGGAKSEQAILEALVNA